MTSTPGTGLKMGNAARRWLNARSGLEAREFTSWDPELDGALDLLTEGPRCPHSLLPRLMEPRPDTPKRVILLTDRDGPVALLPLRFAWRRWEPLTHWIVPGPPIPVRPGHMIRALRAVGLPMRVAWWRCALDPPRGIGITREEEEPTYGIDLTSAYEDHWRSTGHMKSVKKGRNKCGDLSLVLNPPGGAAWTLRSSGEKWREPEDVTEDRVVAAEHLEAAGRFYSLLLYDGDTPTAGHTFIVDRGELVDGPVYRDPSYDKRGVGVNLLDRGCQWAREAGFMHLDLGGGFSYKANWGPERGRKFTLRITPAAEMIEVRLGKLRRLAGRVRSRLTGRA